jgi:hypothetical protein
MGKKDRSSNDLDNKNRRINHRDFLVGGDGADVRPTTAGMLAENPHIKFFNDQRGYVFCSIHEAETKIGNKEIGCQLNGQ